MNQRVDIATDQYAQRMLVRQRMQHKSPEYCSKSLRRRLSVIEALQKNNIMPSTTFRLHMCNNPFEKEFASSSIVAEAPDSDAEAHEMSYVSTWPEEVVKNESQQPNETQERSPIDSNANSIEYRHSNQFQAADSPNSLLQAGATVSCAGGDEPKKHHKFLGEIYERELIESEQKGADQLFSARVLEVIEPQVLHVQPKEPAKHKQDFELSYLQERQDFDSVTTSFLSNQIDDIEQDMQGMHFHIDETPKRLYPNLSLVKRMSDHFTPKKLFHGDQSNTEKEGETRDSKYNQSSSGGKEMYSTPMRSPEPETSEYVTDGEQLSSISFLKRNTSILCSNLRLLRRRPNLESTRKNSRGKLTSPMGSTISTLTLPYTPSSLDHSKLQLRRYVDMPYEVENFLELALGDYNNLDITYAHCDRRNMDSFANASELISGDRTSPRIRIQATRVPMTEPPKHSSTLNRSLSFCKTLTQRIKTKFRGNVRGQPMHRAIDGNSGAIEVTPTLRDSVKKLLETVDIQQTLIYQSSKALELCNSMLEFATSSERVESERLLLLASLRKKAALDEIRRLAGLQGAEPERCSARADLRLSGLSLQLRDEVWRRGHRSDDLLEWLLLVATAGTSVWASQAVACPSHGTRLCFPGELTLPDLPPSFRLRLSIYSLKLRQQALYNHEDKYHIPRSGKPTGRTSTSCPSPTRLLRMAHKRRNLMSPKQYEIKLSGLKESSFAACGSAELALHDLELSPPWPLSDVPVDSVLHGTIELSLRSELKLSVAHTGFLTVGDEAGGFAAWNRRWCLLQGRLLLFWNYPREQESKPPIFSIDLADCASPTIDLVDRSMCARPRTLLVETFRKRTALDRNTIFVECRASYTIIRNLLSCDTIQDLTEWQSKLNHVISALREWNVIDDNHLQ